MSWACPSFRQHPLLVGHHPDRPPLRQGWADQDFHCMTGKPAARSVPCHPCLLPKALNPDSCAAPGSCKAVLERSHKQEAVGEGRTHPSFSSPSKLGSVGQGGGLALALREDLSKRSPSCHLFHNPCSNVYPSSCCFSHPSFHSHWPPSLTLSLLFSFTHYPLNLLILIPSLALPCNYILFSPEYSVTVYLGHILLGACFHYSKVRFCSWTWVYNSSPSLTVLVGWCRP